MNNKIIFFIIGLIALPLVLQIAVVSGQEPAVPYGLSPEQFEDRMTQLEQLRNITQWQLIGERFKLSLLRNSVIAWLDAGFTKASWVFWALFGMDYSLSVALLLVIAFWAWIFLDFGWFLYKSQLWFFGYRFSLPVKLSALSSHGISFVTCIIAAHLGIFENLINAMGTVVFAREAWWARTVLIFMFLGFLYLLHYISRMAGQYLEKQKELGEKEKTAYAGKVIQAKAEGLRKGKDIVEKA